MAVPNYWVAEWLDENEIASDWEVAHCLNSGTGMTSALEIAEETTYYEEVSADNGNLANSIVAGRRLDLSGYLSCAHYDCLRKNIDTTFKHVWHYFDNIVVEGMSPLIFTDRFDNGNESAHRYLVNQLADQARMVLYLREIGADKFTVFAHKTYSYCQEHWLEHATTLGIAEAIDERGSEALIKRILDSSQVKIERMHDDTWGVSLSSSLLEDPRGYVVSTEGKPTPEDVAIQVINDFATGTISDVEIAKRLSLPLIEPTKWAFRNPRAKRKSARSVQQSTRPNANDIALSLSLPVFENLTTRDLIKIREDERPDFEAFRSELRKKINEELVAAKDGAPARVIARNIDENYLHPGLANIERKIRNSRQAVTKKTALDLTIAATGVGIGLIHTLPLMIAGGITALSGGIPIKSALDSYIEDKRSIKEDSLYFLWQVEQRARH